MKVVNLTFSLTGNGLIVANRIEHALVKDNHQIIHFDGCKVLKELNVQIREYPAPAVASENHPTFDSLQAALADADVIGLGSYVHWGLPAPGIYEMLFDSLLKPSDFEHIKYCFTYCTHGSMSNPTKDQLFAYLHELNPAIQLLGSIDVRCPENVHFLLPRMPDQDGWSKSELDRLDKFTSELATIMRADPITPPKQPKPVSFDISANRKSMMKSEAKTHIVVDNDKCVRCGRCISICPWNAMSFAPIAEEKKEEEKKEEEKKEEEKKEEEKKEEEKKEEEKKEEEKKEEEKKEEEKKEEEKKEEEKKEEEKKEEETKEEEKKEEEKTEAAPDASSSSSSSSSTPASQSDKTTKNKKKYDKVVINNTDVCHRCTRCYNWCPTKAISVPPSAHERVQYTAVTYAVINKHPFSAQPSSSSSSSAAAASSEKLLEPKLGNLPSLPRILLRAVFD